MLEEGCELVLRDCTTELRDTFYCNEKKGTACYVCLNKNGLLLQKGKAADMKDYFVKISDIIGGRCVRFQRCARKSHSSCGSCAHGHSDNEKDVADDSEDAYLYIFAYVLKRNRRKRLRRERTVITLRFRSFDQQDENMREAEKWYKLMTIYRNSYLFDLKRNKKVYLKRILVMLNPKSGTGKAKELFHQQVAPVFSEAEIFYDLHITKHSKYAFEFIRTCDLSQYDGIVAVGGDGLFHEVLNGFLNRTDCDAVRNSLSLGVIPCGSGNGLARSIAHCCSEPYKPKPIIGAVLGIVNGQVNPMDVVEIEINKKVTYSFLSVGWGLISDIDIGSELLRPIGYQRFTIWSLHRIINLRTYRGKLSYLPSRTTCSDRFDAEADLPDLQRTVKHDQNMAVANAGVSVFKDLMSGETSKTQSPSGTCRSFESKSAYYSVAESLYHSVSDNSEVNDDNCSWNDDDSAQTNGTSEKQISNSDAPWTFEVGDFVMVHAAYLTHIGRDCFFSPGSRLNDGLIHLVILRSGISRKQLLTFLTSMSSGTHLPHSNTEFIEVVKVRSFHLEPHDSTAVVTVDGERVECGVLKAKIIPNAVNIMIPQTNH